MNYWRQTVPINYAHIFLRLGGACMPSPFPGYAYVFCQKYIWFEFSGEHFQRKCPGRSDSSSALSKWSKRSLRHRVSSVGRVMSREHKNKMATHDYKLRNCHCAWNTLCRDLGRFYAYTTEINGVNCLKNWCCCRGVRIFGSPCNLHRTKKC